MATTSKKEVLTGSAILNKKDKAYATDMIARALKYKALIKENQNLIKEYNKELEPIEKYFDGFLSRGEKIETETGTAMKKIVNSYSVKAEKYTLLKKIFGRKVHDFITEKISYGATSNLKKLLSDANYEHGDDIREAVIIESRTSIDFSNKE